MPSPRPPPPTAARNRRWILALVIGVFFVLCLFTYACFVSSARIIAAIGEAGMSIVTRLMGLILAALSVQLVFEALEIGTWTSPQ